MPLSIGVDCSSGHWKTCLRENGQTLELCSFVDLTPALAYLERVCALYPEPTIALPLGPGIPLTRLCTITSQQRDAIISCPNNQQQEDDLNRFLMAMAAMSLDSYCLPAIRHLHSVPAHRKLDSIDMGMPNKLSIVATLLYRMREREVAWSEMYFFCLEVGYNAFSIVVVEDGRIVYGVSEATGSYDIDCPGTAERFGDREEARQAFEQSFWEGLARDLAGLMAIHHLEDIIVLGQYKDAFVERFGDIYQVYLFPLSRPDGEGYETAIGAAIIAEGLRRPGSAAEVVERLRIY